ncbi:MAG: hypothetical protein HXS53_09505 [Theionarchaea archaeon]|nr:hypothetical protein [Theionarchaea archaeon]
MSQYIGSLGYQGQKLTRLIHSMIKYQGEPWNLAPQWVFPTELERVHTPGGTP